MIRPDWPYGSAVFELLLLSNDQKRWEAADGVDIAWKPGTAVEAAIRSFRDQHPTCLGVRYPRGGV